MCAKLLIFTTVLLLLCAYANSYKFLAVLPSPTRSHHFVGSALFKELVRKGHDVTVISLFPEKTPMKNYHDIEAPSIAKVYAEKMNNFFTTSKHTIVEKMLSNYDIGLRATHALLEEPGVKTLLQSNQTFDAIICEVFLNEATFGLSERFNAPLIGLSTFGAHHWNTDMIGSPSPPSYVPSVLLPFTDHMTLSQRIANLAFITFERIVVDFYYLPKQAEIFNEFFPHSKRTFYEVRKSASLMLLNQHVSLSFPRPHMPNQIEVGGMHINHKRSPLPTELKKFIEESEHGVIYFSMGSNMKSKDLPLAKQRAILNTFRALKQRVLWKFELPDLEGKPDNVYISQWFPQDDILAHDNVKMFITHGGLLSVTESIYHGKPLIGIPIFGDQFLNMGRAEAGGYGIKLDYDNLNEETFKAAIERLLSDATFTQRVQAMSERFRDQPMKPLDLAVYWVEHVARHKGAKYLHCAGLDLNFIQYHNIDVMLILYGGLLLVLWLFVKILKLILGIVWGLLFGKKQQKVKRH